MQSVPVSYKQLSDDYERIEQAILFLEANFQNQPSLSEVAESAGLSEYHFQRLFSRWVGISPKRFLQFLTKEHAKVLLENAGSILDVVYQAGLSSPGRLHDLLVTCEAVTPGEYKLRGEGLIIEYGYMPTPFGECLIAITDRGVCGLTFIEEHNRTAALSELRSRWPKADLRKNPDRTAAMLESIFPLTRGYETAPLHLHLSGTNFQIKVWEALLRIPAGKVVSYGNIASHIGAPGASRAVGQAVGNNPISVIIPCHRVIRKMGAFGSYRWGVARKKAILGWEFARAAV